jgi:hypothetical protein
MKFGMDVLPSVSVVKLHFLTSTLGNTNAMDTRDREVE